MVPKVITDGPEDPSFLVQDVDVALVAARATSQDN